MNKIPGKRLDEVMAKIGDLTNKQKLNLGRSLLECLVEHVHTKGNAHRDLQNPDNILTDIQDHAIINFIIDFGVGRRNSHRETIDSLQVQDTFYISRYVNTCLESYLNNVDDKKLSPALRKKADEFLLITKDWDQVENLSSQEILDMFVDIYNELIPPAETMGLNF
ncbi:hypothetical protein [Legionella maioricensis]|uniref:Protein kinase domain-containing protein n=1 Tax=Legionella maioricensis TaxID=2896528 RepID=A0A9X2ICE4_9GAMM|nr:hypothetical protein [Legionella maioricensis]MCL9683678.1 hypothetical protein [Legionella maioricensis]MCL9687452.1 hypothetical protein [Legionella maioricensis]